MTLVQFNEEIIPSALRFDPTWLEGGEASVPEPIRALSQAVALAKGQLDSVWQESERNKMGRRMRQIDPFSQFRIPTAQCLSNSWFKYYELFSYYCRDTAVKTPRVFFNAELPGGSLSAWNHFRRGQTHWVASSLYPTEGNDALPDRHKLYENNPGKWLMGPDAPHSPSSEAARGDATSMACIEYWARECNGRIDLYSHDAGMDASSDYNNQELINSRLHLGCALVGLLTLKLGGTFIAKQYTPFETCTLGLILCLAGEFQDFRLVKPESSRARNSEIYLVGRGYRGQNPHLIAEMKRVMAQGGDAAMEISGPAFALAAESLGSITQFAQRVYAKQIASIQTLFGPEDPHWPEQVAQIRQAWLAKHNPPKLELRHGLSITVHYPNKSRR